MTPHVLEVDGPEGQFVIRAEPVGISIWSAMRWNPLPYVLRLLRRDRAWAVRIRLQVDDPLGSPLYEEVVPSKAHLPEVMRRAEQRVRNGRVRAPSSSSKRPSS